MIEKSQTLTRSLTEELLHLNQQAIDWNMSMSKQAEKQVVSAFETSRSTVTSLVELQRDATRAWLKLVAPEAEAAA